MKGKYANIIIDISHEKVDRLFQYRIPDRLQERITVGMAVSIPFGAGNTLRSGYVIEITNNISFEESKIKEIADIREKEVTVESNLIRLAGFIQQHYGSTMITALKTVLPAKQKIKGLQKKTLILKVLPEEAGNLTEVFRKKGQVAKAELLEGMIGALPQPFLFERSRQTISDKSLQSMEKQGILQVFIENTYRNPLHATMKEVKEEEILSASQQRIIDEIAKDALEDSLGTYLIHGITGSGKTRVYMEIIKDCIQKGKQAIVLIPEIALTYQTLSRFYQYFGNRVSFMNSKLSSGEKYDQMERAKKGEIDIMIGPRSALFTPFSNLGVIIIDEEHENSYKSESVPRYHAREVAIELARMNKAAVVLGSATPSLEAYYKTQKGEITLFELQERLAGGSLPQVETVDLREELKAGNRSIFSRKLESLIEDRLGKKQQIMLFLNRRGYAGFVSCRACGHVMKCPHCDVSLSEHKNQKLMCHYCGYEEAAVHKCPKCGSKYILGFKAGTQQVEEAISRKFPNAVILRMDGDTTKTKDSYEKILEAFSEKKADILVGTQMIVKGHDFPNVSLVGILAADLSLCANDYRAGERTFQLLTQAAGRAGRGEIPGEVIIQTYQPEHYSIIHAMNQNYKAFYEEEMLYRQMLLYPPEAHIMAVLVVSTKEDRAAGLVKKLADSILKVYTPPRWRVVGPTKATVGKINDRYRYVFYIKSQEYQDLISCKDSIEATMNKDLEREEIVQFDFDPMNCY